MLRIDKYQLSQLPPVALKLEINPTVPVATQRDGGAPEQPERANR
jgi:hypothetical protein